MVHATTSAGGGLILLRAICSSVDLPPPVHTAPYSKYLKVVLRSAIDNCEESIKHAAKDRVKDGTSRNEITVSYDGRWQKQYGHT